MDKPNYYEKIRKETKHDTKITSFYFFQSLKLNDFFNKILCFNVTFVNGLTM